MAPSAVFFGALTKREQRKRRGLRLVEAANALTGQRAGALDARQVMALYADHQLIHMLPSIDFEEQKRFRQGTQAAQVIDYFAQNFHKP